jgi:trans-aconitate methyltransferase
MAHQHHRDHGHDWGARAAELEFEGELSLSWAPGAMAWLAERVPEPGGILDLGAGPGVFTAALATAFPAAQVTAVDNAPESPEGCVLAGCSPSWRAAWRPASCPPSAASANPA